MTNNTTNEPEDSTSAATTARRPGPLAGRLGTGAGASRPTVLGRGLDSLLGNLRTTPKPHEQQPEPQPEDDATTKYQTQPRRALLTRLESTAPPAASTAPAPAAPPTRSDFGRGFTHLMQAGVPAATGYVPATGGENDENRVIRIEVERLEPNPYHGDARHDPDSLRGLAQAVREQGLWQPLVVMPAPATPGDPVQRYWIISGERQWRAAIMVGQREVPVLVRQVSPRAALQMALAEHTHHGQMSPLTRSRVFGTLTGDMGMTIEETAERIGVSVEVVATSLQVLTADDFLQESFDRGEITEGMVVLLLHAPTPEVRRKLLRYAIRYRWNETRLVKGMQSRGIEL